MEITQGAKQHMRRTGMLSLTGSTGARNGHDHSCAQRAGKMTFCKNWSWLVVRLSPGVRLADKAGLGGEAAPPWTLSMRLNAPWDGVHISKKKKFMKKKTTNGKI